METESEQKQAYREPTPFLVRKGLTVLFIIFLLIGTCTVILFDGRSAMMASAVVILIYAVFGFFLDRKVKNTEKFADSLYYIGFLLTLISLLKFTLGGENEKTTAQLISSMGTGMTTTILGLALRVVMIQFRDTVSDQEEEAKDTIANTLLLLEQHVKSAKKSMDDVSTVIKGQLDSLSNILADGNNQVSIGLTNLSLEINKAKDIIQTNTEAAEELIRQCLNPTIEIAMQINTDLQKEFKELEGSLTNLTTRISAVQVPRKMIEERMDKMIELFQNRATAGLKPLYDAQTECAHAVDLVAKEINSIHTIIGNDHKSIRDTAKAISGISREISITGESFATSRESIKEFGGTLKTAITNLRTSTDDLTEISKSQTELVRTLSELTENVRGLNEKLKIDRIKGDGDLGSKITAAFENFNDIIVKTSLTKEKVNELYGLGVEINTDLMNAKAEIKRTDQYAKDINKAASEIVDMLKNELSK